MRDTYTIALPSMTIRTLDLDGVPSVDVAGDLDAVNGAQFLAVLTARLDEYPPGLVVDLTRTEFFCSAGINALIAAATQARRQGVVMAVVADHPTVLRPLRITGVDEVLNIHPTLDRALAALRTERVRVDQ